MPTTIDEQKLDSLLDEMRERRELPPPAVRRALREQSGLSQQHIAELLGVDAATISRYESGEREPVRSDLVHGYMLILKRLAEKLGARK